MKYPYTKTIQLDLQTRIHLSLVLVIIHLMFHLPLEYTPYVPPTSGIYTYVPPTSGIYTLCSTYLWHMHLMFHLHLVYTHYVPPTSGIYTLCSTYVLYTYCLFHLHIVYIWPFPPTSGIHMAFSIYIWYTYCLFHLHLVYIPAISFTSWSTNLHVHLPHLPHTFMYVYYLICLPFIRPTSCFLVSLPIHLTSVP